MDRDTIIVSADFEEGCVGVCPDEFFTFFVIIISILYDFTTVLYGRIRIPVFCYIRLINT